MCRNSSHPMCSTQVEHHNQGHKIHLHIQSLRLSKGTHKSLHLQLYSKSRVEMYSQPSITHPNIRNRQGSCMDSHNIACLPDILVKGESRKTLHRYHHSSKTELLSRGSRKNSHRLKLSIYMVGHNLHYMSHPNKDISQKCMENHKRAHLCR